MAATVAIMLYMELPRVAFEAQRDKEQLLIDRGEQYSRAVNLFVRKFNRYPADFEALQNTQNLRFLRHKYVDPMTGKDDWRIVHVGPGGVFTDSLIYGKKKTGTATEAQSFITEMQQTGGNQTGAAPSGVNIGTRQRQSDQPGAPGDPNNPTQPQPGSSPVNGPVMVMPDGRIVPVGPDGQPIVQLFPTAQAQPVQQPFPNNNGAVQPPPGVQFPQGFQLPPGFQQNPNQVGGQANAPAPSAANLINQILTTPRPGGLNGIQGQQPGPFDPNANTGANTNQGAMQTGFPGGAVTGGLFAPNTGTALPAMQGQTIGGGIAGVASKREQDGIKTYRDHTPYNEWEFVYDLTKDPLRGGGAAAAAASTANPVPGGGSAIPPIGPGMPPK